MPTSVVSSTSNEPNSETEPRCATKNKTFTVVVEAPRTCVTTLEVTAATRKDAEERARDMVKYNEVPMIWNPAANLMSLGIRTKVLST